MTLDDAGFGATWYRALLDASAEGIIVIDASGTVHTFSRGAEAMFGYDANEVVGANVKMLMPVPFRDAHDGYLQRYATTGQARIIGTGRDLQALHRDGTTFGIHLRVGETLINNERMFVGIVSDQRERDEARYWFDEFFNLTLELLGIITFSGRFVRLNPAWTNALGHSREALLDQPLIELVHPDDIESTLDMMAVLRDGHDVVGFANRYRSADGTYRWLEWSAHPLPGRAVFIAVAHDITGRREAEDLLRVARDQADRANRAKSEFLSRMSHELRTPLNSVIGFAQLLDMEDLSPEQHEHVTYIQRSGRHLLDLINEVLDITQIETGQLRISLEPVPVAEGLRMAIDLIRPLAAEQCVTVTEPFGHDGLHVVADRQRLLQVLLNLLSNAVKFNRPDGMVTITCEASAHTVTIGITDTGIGIGAVDLSKIFTPFERLGAQHTAVPGTGVGLALSRALSQQMGGTLTVSSEVGTGSTFCLELPQADPPPTGGINGTQPAPVSKPESRAHEPPFNVLCIEQDVANVRLMERALDTQHNITITSAIQGRLGLELASRTPPDLILLDLQLPDMPGREVLQRLRANPDLRATPIIMCSADPGPGEAQRLADQGATAYLTKPIELRELFEIIADLRSAPPTRI